MDLLLVISGPVDLVFVDFLIQKIPQKILENMWGDLGKILFSMYDNQHFRNCSKGKPSLCFDLFFVYIFGIYFLNIYLQNNFVEMRTGK